MDDLQPGDPGSVGGYRLLGRLGAGGMGQVYLGVSPSGRRVAVKLIHPVHAGTAQFRQRFAREIDAARRVGGFHTAVVVDADPQADPPWMVTAYIDGPSLQAEVERGGPLPADGVRALGAGLAEGLAAIHACGLVHRDLKPANVILAPDGPRIIDFGIARAADATTGLTSTGVVVGTFAYMPPEQLRGEVAGTASDVFALGGVLAFAATGRPPFGREPAATVMFRIVTEPPDLTGLADEGLRRLIGGCLAKAPQARPTVQALLSALSAPAPAAAPAAPNGAVPFGARIPPSGAVPIAAVTPTQTQAPTPVSTGREAVMPPGTGSAAADALTPAAKTGPGGSALRRSDAVPPGQPPWAGRGAPVQAAQPSPAGVRRGRRSRRRPAIIGTAALIAAAAAVAVPLVLHAGTPQTAAGHHPTVAAGLVRTGGPKTTPSGTSSPIPNTLRSPTASASSAILERDLLLQTSSDGIAFSPNGRLLANDAGTQIDLLNVSTGTRVATMTVPGISTASSSDIPFNSPLSGATFNPSGTLLAAGSGSSNRVYLWSTSTDSLVTTLTGPSPKNADYATITGVAFSPDGSLLAASDENNDVYVWDLATGALKYDLITASILSSVEFSPNGKYLAAGGTTAGLQTFLWDVATGERLANLIDPGGSGVGDIAFSPDSTLLAAADLGHAGRVFLWNTSTHSLVTTLPSTKEDGGALALAWSPDGTLLASGDNYSYTYLWDVAAQKTVGQYHGVHDASMGDVAFSPDGKLLAMTDAGGYVYVRLISELTS
jgi:WD40 repeat protein